MPTVEKFEELEIWQLARKVCQRIYLLTFLEPIKSDYRFKDQIRGSCGSMMDNIAEGFGRGSQYEFINSLTIAKGEAEELKSQLYRGLDIKYFPPALFAELYDQVELTARKIGTLINYLNQSNIRGKKFSGRNNPSATTKNPKGNTPTPPEQSPNT
ncbi:four helix bundle protein [Cnuella takakiae]|uniref:Four helix bundle protein n=1 Tax=Cnuella takakiae TaxID=1302690 RepID=A0A1M5ENF8_9BACT|nr:four helix bundle protein [Cnuella takakiae]OLY91237.1 hypothetical protein BUE76_04465 [Cnuella takakiae]SHF80631.1 four helix bundle protein [Cnuella takakiae]